MNPLFLLIIPLAQILIAIFVLLRNPRNPQHWSFALLMISIAAWGALNLSEKYFPVALHTLIGRLIFAFASLIPSFFFVFVLSIDNKQENKHLLLAPVLLGAIFFVFSLTPAVVEYDIFDQSGQFNGQYGWGHPVFAGYFLSFIILTIILLIQKFRIASGIQKYKIGYILLGVIISLLIAIPTNLILPLTGQSNLSDVGPVASIFLTLLTAYAILKYRFLDVRVVIRKSLVYAILASVFAGLVVFFVILLAQALENSFAISAWTAAAVIAFVISATLFAFKSLAQRFVNLLLPITSPADTLPQDASELIVKACAIMQDVVKVDAVEIHLLRDLRRRGWSEKTLANLHAFAMAKRKSLLAQEIPYMREDKNVAPLLNSLERQLFEKDIAVAVPMLSRNEDLIGALILGPKRTSALYTAHDISYLESFSRGISMRLQQIFQYERERKSKMKSHV